jgi:hypothetical protein
MPQILATLQRSKGALALPRRYGQRPGLVEGTSPRWLLCHCTDKTGNVYSVPLKICRAVLLMLRQRLGAAGSGLATMVKYLRRTTSAEPNLHRKRRRRNNALKMRQRRPKAAASDSNSPKVHRRESYLTTVYIKPVSSPPGVTTHRPLPVRLKLLTMGLASSGCFNLSVSYAVALNSTCSFVTLQQNLNLAAFEVIGGMPTTFTHVRSSLWHFPRIFSPRASI